MRDPPAERARSKQASAWEAFLRGERVAVGRRLAVAYKSPKVDGEKLRGTDSRESDRSSRPRLSQPPGEARSAVPGVQNSLLRRLARKLTLNLPTAHKLSEMIQMVKCETHATNICTMAFDQEMSEFHPGVMKVSITSPYVLDRTGLKGLPSFMFTGWSTLKSTCLSLTALVSELMLLKLMVLCRSSSSKDAPQHLESQQEDTNSHFQQANGPIHSPTDLVSTKNNSGRITEDRPD